MGGWAVAQSFILKTIITTSRLKRKVYKPLLYYSNIRKLQFGEPPYTFLSCNTSRNRDERTNIVTYVRCCERYTPTILVGAVYSIVASFIAAYYFYGV